MNKDVVARASRSKLPAAVLPTVMVAATLIALSVLGVVALWEADFLFFSRHRHRAMQRAHVLSGFTLYCEYPDETIARLDADSTLLLYDSLPGSRIKIERRPLGLYEKLTITAADGKTHVSKILGKRSPCEDDFLLWCRDYNASLTLTGKTRIKGPVRTPRGQVIYGQMGRVFFDGEKIGPGMMGASGNELPETDSRSLAAVEEIMASAAEDVFIDRTQKLRDTVIVGKKVRIESGFRGSLQVFASDSLHLEKGVSLDYPSGLFSEKYIHIADDCTVNGFVIVHPADKPDVRHANYVSSRLATIRGLVWVGGPAQIQGMVSGIVMLDKAVYYSPRGYYENMIVDATILENRDMAWPLWMVGPPERKEAKWVD